MTDESAINGERFGVGEGAGAGAGSTGAGSTGTGRVSLTTAIAVPAASAARLGSVGTTVFLAPGLGSGLRPSTGVDGELPTLSVDDRRPDVSSAATVLLRGKGPDGTDD